MTFETTVNGHQVTYGRVLGRSYQYGWECDCKGFKYRKTCRHIKEAEGQRCGWNQNFEEYGPIEKCPDCGGPTEVVKVGI